MFVTPLSATDRQESEMVNSTFRELHAGGCGSTDPLQRLRLLCLSRGANGILELSRLFRWMDKDHNKRLNMKEFIMGLQQIGLEVSDDEVKAIFERFDTEGNGRGMDIDEFLTRIRPPVCESRMNVLEKAFQTMDKTGDGQITIGDLKRVYNVNSNPRYIAGEDSKESIVKTFLDHFKQGATNGEIITKEEFFDYYSAVSASIDNDGYFDLMMRQAFKL